MIADTKRCQDVTVISLSGSLDVSRQPAFKERLLRLLHDGKDADLVLDFAGVAFIDSACLGVLVAFMRRVREKKGDIKLAHLTSDVRSIFQITRLDKVFEIYGTIAEAVDSFYRDG